MSGSWQEGYHAFHLLHRSHLVHHNPVGGAVGAAAGTWAGVALAGTVSVFCPFLAPFAPKIVWGIAALGSAAGAKAEESLKHPSSKH